MAGREHEEWNDGKQASNTKFSVFRKWWEAGQKKIGDGEEKIRAPNGDRAIFTIDTNNSPI